MVPPAPHEPADRDKAFDLSAFRQAPVDEGLSLDQLSAALAGMLDSGDDPYTASGQALDDAPLEAAVLGLADSSPPAADSCEITPRSILEAMLFVGNASNEPLTAKQVAGLMRGVRPSEIDALVRELNETYEQRNCPYTIAAEGSGYRLKLRDRYARLRDQFYGKGRLARLSQAAIEVLATVAYRAPITAEEISTLRGTPSSHILTNLVRRGLLRLERKGSKPAKVQYYTTPRFLELFGLGSLDDLPRNEDLDLA
jgi:segregation and condensation protein B